MSNYDNTNSGALFKNDKEGNESRPDYKGKINVRGEDFYLAAWLKKSKNGTNYMSLSVSEITDSKGQTKANNQPQSKPAQQEVSDDDWQDQDIPF